MSPAQQHGSSRPWRTQLDCRARLEHREFARCHWLVADGDKLAIEATSNADLPLIRDKHALITCDVCEHTYYIDYRNRRPDYLKAFLDNMVNWDHVEEMFVAATK